MNNCGFSELSGSRNIICGLGRSNEALVSFLDKQGAMTFVSDKRKSENEITEVLQRLGIKNGVAVPYGSYPKADFIYRTPSLRPDSEEITVATERGAILTSEVELFFKYAKGKIFGITGSDGKTTTTTVVNEILKQKYGEKHVFCGGNIGIPLISFIKSLDNDSITVCELSSFQLMTADKAPSVSAITNITENHLDIHKSMDEYACAKCNIFAYDDCKRLVISDQALEVVNKYGKKLPNEVIKTALFENGSGIGLFDGYITLFGENILRADSILARGKHNISNFMTAIGMTYGFADKEQIERVARTFKGVAHRIEYVMEKYGVTFYNSSIDSTPSRTLVTLSTFENQSITENDSITLILGGYDKNLDYSALAEYASKKVNNFILLGANAQKIKNALKKHVQELNRIIEVKDLYEAVIASLEVTKRNGTVLLSPASASFDMFENFEMRGECFENIINSI